MGRSGPYGPYKRRMRKNRYKGVYRNGRGWEAKAWRDGTWYRGGVWDTQREAAAAYNTMLEMHKLHYDDDLNAVDIVVPAWAIEQRLRRGPTVLTRDAIRDICRRALSGESQQQIAEEYGLVKSVVSKIRNGHEHAEVTRDIRQERGWE